MRRSPAAALAFFLASSALAAEGKWTPQQVLQLGAGRLRELGLELPPERLWDPARGTGLLAGAVQIRGCSGGFVSKDGLFVTNHHCLFSIVQEHSSPKRNLIEDGFLARARPEELPGKAERLRVPRRFTDVTREILAAVPEGADDLGRAKAIERRGKELVRECEKRPATRCAVASFDGGLWYTLVDAIELADVRLVYAPPRAVGEFGGEIDNWQWPRHTGDFAIARAYVAPDGSAAPFDPKNVPYQAEFFFPLAEKGVSPDDFVMVLGYPGRTYRSFIAEEVAERQEQFFPARVEAYGEWIGLLEEKTRTSKEGRILVAADLKSLQNRHKNAEGQLAGMARGRHLEHRRAQEEAVVAFAEGKPEHAGALDALRELRAIVAAQRATFARDFLLDHLQPGGLTVSKALSWPTALARVARERAKPDLDREPPYMDRNLPMLREWLEREQKRLFVPADQAVTLSFVRRALALPKGQRLLSIDRAFGRVKPAELPAAIARLYRRTRVLDPRERAKMFEETEARLRARRDPLLDLGLDLAHELAARVERADRLEGAISRLRPRWRRAVIAHAGRPVDPDANGTLRVTFGKVRGYSPRDGVYHLPQTTLAGMLEKGRDEPPFVVPPRVKAAAAAGSGRWADPKLGDLPIDFLSDCDTTGGNSGSPAVNARGELVGVNFDRVWENVANDFGYDPDVARNVNADVRYLLWMLDRVEGAGALLGELGVARR